jgi:hypothetical protein
MQCLLQLSAHPFSSTFSVATCTDGGQYSSDDGLEHRVPIKSTLTGGPMAGTHHNPTHLLPHPDIYPHPSQQHQHHRRGRSGSRSGSGSPRGRGQSGSSSPRGQRGQHPQQPGPKHHMHYPREIQHQLEARNALLASNPEVMARRKAIAQAAFVRWVGGTHVPMYKQPTVC